MKKLLFLLTAVALIGCNEHKPISFFENLAHQWSAKFGEPNAKVVCLSHKDMFNSDRYAYCSIEINNSIYNLICWTANNYCEPRIYQ